MCFLLFFSKMIYSMRILPMTAQPPESQHNPHANSPALRSPAAAVPVINSAELLNGVREIRIRHGEEMYRLRLTKNDKLILHK